MWTIHNSSWNKILVGMEKMVIQVIVERYEEIWKEFTAISA